MTTYELLRLIDASGYVETLCKARVMNPSIGARYRRYSYYLEQKSLHVNEKHYDILLDVSITLKVSVQTLYEDIRLLEKVIL